MSIRSLCTLSERKFQDIPVLLKGATFVAEQAPSTDEPITGGEIYANHTGAADSRGHVEPEMTELVGYPGSRFLLMQREFRVAMQVHVERFDLRVDAIDLVFGRRTPGISGKQRRN